VTTAVQSQAYNFKVELEDVTLSFAPGVDVVQNVSLRVRPGEFVAIVGPSGCGKSTLLNVIASLLPPNEVTISGRILINGEEAGTSSKRHADLGYVFQKDALLPWRTIVENVEVGLEIRGMPVAARRAKARELMAMAGLLGYEHYYPHQVSGGMRQRTSLIRTLAYEPELILMDEPFGALDAQTRMILQAELLNIWYRLRKTILFVTHDLAEAIILAQRVVLFSKRPGRVRQVYELDLPYPRNPFELRGSPEFGRLETTIWQALREEFMPSGADPKPL
jgi:NitT/TauT family transport system ATP-binding protein